MRKFSKSLWIKFNRIEIRNNFVYPSNELLYNLGITFQEFMFFKWKKHKELEYIQNSSKENNNIKENNKINGEWRGSFRMRWYNKK